jgi:hypothetical protein
MFKTNPFAGITPFRGGNGSVPSIGGAPSLAAALAAVTRAEDALEAARRQAKAVARREGRGVKNLFAEGRFVLRASAEKWCDEARREGEKTMAAIFSRNLDEESRDQNSPFRHLAKRLKQIQDWPAHVAEMRALMDSAGPRWEQMRAAGYFDAIERGDHDEAAAIYRECNPELFGKGAAIVAAGKRARMSADAAGEVPEPGGLAKKIVDSGRRRRGEIE